MIDTPSTPLDAVRQWLEHDALCPAFAEPRDPVGHPCSCGLAEALGRAEGMATAWDWEPFATLDKATAPREFMLGNNVTGAVNRGFFLEGELVMVGGKWTPTHWCRITPPPGSRLFEPNPDRPGGQGRTSVHRSERGEGFNHVD